MKKNTLPIRIMQILLAIFFSQSLAQITTASVDQNQMWQSEVINKLEGTYAEKDFISKNSIGKTLIWKNKSKPIENPMTWIKIDVNEPDLRKENSGLQKENASLNMTVSKKSELLHKEKYQALELSMQKKSEESVKKQQEYSETEAQQNTIIQNLEKKFTILAWIAFFLSIILFFFIIYIKTRADIQHFHDHDHSETFSDTEHTVSDDILKVNTDVTSESVTQEEKICFYSMGSDTYEKMKKQHFRSTSNNPSPPRLSIMHHKSRKYLSRNNSSTSNNTSCKLEQSLSASHSRLNPDL